MNRIRLGLVLTTATLLTPVSLHAATEMDALNACATALAAEIGDAQGSPVTFQFSQDSLESHTLLKGRTTYYLNAAAPGTGAIVARANCEVDSTGEVRSLKQLHQNSFDARHHSAIR